MPLIILIFLLLFPSSLHAVTIGDYIEFIDESGEVMRGTVNHDDGKGTLRVSVAEVDVGSMFTDVNGYTMTVHTSQVTRRFIGGTLRAQAKTAGETLCGYLFGSFVPPS